RVTMHWPGIASCLDGTPRSSFYNPAATGVVDLLHAYAACNPHATFALRLHDVDGPDCYDWPATAPTWSKWQPSSPTSAHWYDARQLRALIAAYVAQERQGGPVRTVREFVAEFAGLSSTAKQKGITEALGLSRARLHDLIAGDDIDASSA